MKGKKGQTSLNEAPIIVLIVGLTFLMLATLAFIGSEYGESIKNTITATVNNETGAINSTGYTLDGASELDATSFSITTATNATGGETIASGNYTLSSSGVVTNTTDEIWQDVNFTYTYSYTSRTHAYNVTEDLQEEVEDNTSIAGIVLTISLVGIVLTVLIGIFVGFRRKGF
jgi:hypothetical protein